MRRANHAAKIDPRRGRSGEQALGVWYEALDEGTRGKMVHGSRWSAQGYRQGSLPKDVVGVSCGRRGRPVSAVHGPGARRRRGMVQRSLRRLQQEEIRVGGGAGRRRPRHQVLLRRGSVRRHRRRGPLFGHRQRRVRDAPRAAEDAGQPHARAAGDAVGPTDLHHGVVRAPCQAHAPGDARVHVRGFLNIRMKELCMKLKLCIPLIS
mmetsp:Transcript_3811/g.12673  ORF Transcript_3811/g.12673 Transcript_3811/m.12673 type:complete len:207 (-) Transcript_3811:122-742(-)